MRLKIAMVVVFWAVSCIAVEYECSNCGMTILREHNVCSNCGRRISAGYDDVYFSMGLMNPTIALSIQNRYDMGVEQHLCGLSLGVLGNVYQEQRGVELGLFNIAAGESASYGVSLGLHNVSENVCGLHLGMINFSGRVCGVQIGVLNYSEGLTGLQIGLANCNKGGPIKIFPGINIGW